MHRVYAIAPHTQHTEHMDTGTHDDGLHIYAMGIRRAMGAAMWLDCEDSAKSLCHNHFTVWATGGVSAIVHRQRHDVARR